MTTEEKTKPMTDLFDQAARNYEQLFRNGLKLQQESYKWWATLFGEPASDLQPRFKAMADKVAPQTQKSLDEYVKLLEQNSRTSVDVLKKAIAVTQSSSMKDAQEKMFGVWEASLNALRDNTQAVAQANTKAMEALLEMIRKSGEAARSSAAAHS